MKSLIFNTIKIETFLRRAKFFTRLIYFKMLNKPVPFLATFSLTPQCNFDCTYCYGDYKSRISQKELLTTNDVITAIGELAKMGMSFLQLSGGEPLIRKDIDIIVNRANALGITLGISTNGSLVEQKIETVKKIRTICISFDGNEESNDANRGKGAYKLIMRAIKVAKEAGVQVHTYSTINRNNINAIDYIMEFAKRFDIYTEFGFPVCRTLRNDREYHRLDLTQEEFRNVVKKLLAYKRKGYPILFSAQVMEKILKWPDYDEKMIIADIPPSFEHVQCFGGRHMVFIDCDGRVYPCIQFIGNFDAWDFRLVGIKKAVEHSAQHSCKACYLMCVNDFNLMFSLHPSVLYNYFSITLDEALRPHKFDSSDFVHFTGL